ncbi:MAG TPA: hypothetical protein VFU32_06225 [Ktedonobacterales bacterium]|nr:hypothetical protein [Ktedonobacterales bacterium]
MSESESTNLYPQEEADESLDDVAQLSVTVPLPSKHPPAESESSPIPFPRRTTQTAALPNQSHYADPAKAETHQDFAHIIARAREEIRRLRQELTKLEMNAAAIGQERNVLQQKYQTLYDTFLETTHVAAGEEIRQAARDLQKNPERIPALLEPIYDAIARWHETQQAEREQALVLKLATVEKQAERIREAFAQERQALNAERDKLAQQRQTLQDQIKARETGLRHRWFAKAWAASTIMFLVLPVLQIYLLTQKASPLSIIITPTVLCLAVLGVISFVRARKRPVVLKK